MAMLGLQKQKDLEPTKTWQRPIAPVKSGALATAQTFYIDIPRDSFIHEIVIMVGEHATDPLSGLADDLLDIKLVGNGNKYLKDAFGLASFFVQVERLHRKRHVTGIYRLIFSDPDIPEAQPLPAWIFTSLQLILTDNAPAAATYHFINVTLVESAYDSQRHGNLDNWKILLEKCLTWKKFGANTGEQLYEHERAYKIFAYMYAMDDNSVLSATIFDKLKVTGRNPRGEIIITDSVYLTTLKAENNGSIIQDLDVGFAFLQFAKGFPTADFSSLYSKLNISVAGVNAGVRVLERYIL
jgi:hypothetical protein